MDIKQGKISSNIEYLEELHNKFSWIPGKEQIRPNKDVLEKKENDIINLIPFYNSYSDYIYDIIFNYKMKINQDGKLELDQKPNNNYIFRKNDYPYNVNNGTNHYVIWYNNKEEDITEDIINLNIIKELTKINGNDQFEYIWYENPKKSFPLIYHLQVFWHKI